MPKLPAPFYNYENLQVGLKEENLSIFKEAILDILKAPDLIFEQKNDALAATAANALAYPKVSEEAAKLIESGVFCLLAEGAAPYHPRYVAPDYERLLKKGSKFLDLEPAIDLFDAITSLITAYKYSPSSGSPVFIGRLDDLLTPFIDTVDEKTAYLAIRSFWQLVDRLFPSAFVHSNIGPQETKAGNILLDVDKELSTITNVTLRYDPETTPDTFALKAISGALKNTKPYFLNHQMMVKDWGEDYAIASCYNAMRMGGGIYTLVRLNLKAAAALSDGSSEDFLQRVLPEIAPYWVEIIDSRAKRVVEDFKWYEENFWIDEGFLEKEKFTSYAGIFGLSECVNHIMNGSGNTGKRYGHDKEANQFAKVVTDRIHQLLELYPIENCEGTGGVVCYHAQVGISDDVEVTPATRVPSQEEPDLYSHISAEAPNHEWLDGGVSTILEFDQTANRNPEAVLDIIKGAFKSGIRNLSIGGADSEFIRVTGYLMLRSDMEAARNEKAMRHGSAFLGTTFMENTPNHLHRRTRQV
jgi:YjjI family glycine radical enzyme